MRCILVLASIFFALLGCCSGQESSLWQTKLKQRLPFMGHRNWIAIVDSAYPAQVSPGVETIFCDGDQDQVVETVLQMLAQSKSVTPTIFTDLELNAVPEVDAPGITLHRSKLSKVLAGHEIQAIPHEEIIGKLDEAGKIFRVIILKTHLTLPYTSVFLQLQCGYWNADAEARLRQALSAKSFGK